MGHKAYTPGGLEGETQTQETPKAPIVFPTLTPTFFNP